MAISHYDQSFASAKVGGCQYSGTVRPLRAAAAATDAAGRGGSTTAAESSRCHVNNAKEKFCTTNLIVTSPYAKESL
jgi:hypothetical protein